METKRVIIDAGHGGSNPGAVFNGRREKDDVLNLALAVGKLLSQSGVDVTYTRVDDTYDSPLEKAMIANRSGADYFISLHRNAMPIPGTASGVETLVFRDEGVPRLMAENINAALSEAGFNNLGIVERPGLIVLRRTQMPAALVEVGFIDNEADNRLFDRNFDAIAQAIANGILTTIEMEQEDKPMYYQIQVGAYQDREQANQLLNQLRSQGFSGFLVHDDGYYKVRVGAYLNLDNAAQMEKTLRDYGYQTYMVREPERL